MAAAGKLLQLNREELAYGFGLSGSQSAGLRENFGTMTKPLHAGLAAENGVRSAMLAKLAFTSSKTIFEGRYGFCNVASEKSNPTEVTAKLGKWDSVSNIRLKLYPCCALTYSAIDAARSIIRDYGLKRGDLEAVTVTANPMVRGIVPFDNPVTPLEAKFSMPFCVAAALTDGHITLQHFTQEKLEAREITQIIKRVKFVFDAKVPDFGAVVEVRGRDGRTCSHAIDQPKGTAENPLSPNEIIEKFKSCAKLALSEDQVERLLTKLMILEELDDVGDVLSMS
jgi:2-methylcitrate dehydratase PrpD